MRNGEVVDMRIAVTSEECGKRWAEVETRGEHKEIRESRNDQKERVKENEGKGIGRLI